MPVVDRDQRLEGEREMMLGKSSMDLVLVPCALAVMVSYHHLLLYRILRHPNTTVIGYENHNKLAWVSAWRRPPSRRRPRWRSMSSPTAILDCSVLTVAVL